MVHCKIRGFDLKQPHTDMKSIHALTLALLVAPAGLAAQPPAAKPDLARGQAIATQVCAACHSVDGSRGTPANPILAGQHPEYIVKQLTEFKADKRKNPIMKGFASALSEEDMRNVAAFYASKQAKPGFAKNKELVALGERIYRGGIAGAQVAACAGCHSPTGAGIPVHYPRLAGQHAEYVEAQMHAFRGGERTNSPEMTAMAERMSDREIKAVADYIAGLR
jgi:cytochrome c553